MKCLLLTCLVLLHPLTAVSQENNAVAKARVDFLKQVEKFRTVVTNHLEQIESTARARGDLNTLKKVEQARTAFSKNGILPIQIPPNAGLIFERSKARLVNSYRKEIRNLVRQGNDKQADALQEELKQLLFDPISLSTAPPDSVAAKIAIVNLGAHVPLRKGAHVYTNHPARWTQIPDPFSEWEITRHAFGRPSRHVIEVQEPGLVYACTFVGEKEKEITDDGWVVADSIQEGKYQWFILRKVFSKGKHEIPVWFPRAGIMVLSPRSKLSVPQNASDAKP